LEKRRINKPDSRSGFELLKTTESKPLRK